MTFHPGDIVRTPHGPGYVAARRYDVTSHDVFVVVRQGASEGEWWDEAVLRDPQGEDMLTMERFDLWDALIRNAAGEKHPGVRAYYRAAAALVRLGLGDDAMETIHMDDVRKGGHMELRVRDDVGNWRSVFVLDDGRVRFGVAGEPLKHPQASDIDRIARELAAWYAEERHAVD